MHPQSRTCGQSATDVSDDRLANTDCWIGDGQDWLTWEQAEALADDLATMTPWLVVCASHQYERHNRMDLTEHGVEILNTRNGQRWGIGTREQARTQRAVSDMLTHGGAWRR